MSVPHFAVSYINYGASRNTTVLLIFFPLNRIGGDKFLERVAFFLNNPILLPNCLNVFI